MILLTSNEEMILIALYRLGGSAHGPHLRMRLIELTGRSIIYGSLYNSLENLIRKEYVESQRGKPTPERGGKAKSIYSITKKGRETLLSTRKVREKLWSGLKNTNNGVKDPIK
jgi:DNA-binding PadR family transcriptional regulator